MLGASKLGKGRSGKFVAGKPVRTDGRSRKQHVTGYVRHEADYDNAIVNKRKYFRWLTPILAVSHGQNTVSDKYVKLGFSQLHTSSYFKFLKTLQERVGSKLNDPPAKKVTSQQIIKAFSPAHIYQT